MVHFELYDQITWNYTQKIVNRGSTIGRLQRKYLTILNRTEYSLFSRMEGVVPLGARIGDFTVVQHAGHGGYGEVYYVFSQKQQKMFAMKLEMNDIKSPALEREANHLHYMRNAYFPKLYDAGRSKKFKYCIIEALGCSVGKIMKISHPLPIAEAYVISREMLLAIKELHAYQIVHNDIKASNFLLRPRSDRHLCLIDLGIAYHYIDPKTNERYPLSRTKEGYGTFKYSSPNAHYKLRLAPRDDLYSWFYTIIEMFGGRLPWKHTEDKSEILKSKIAATTQELCKGLPSNFRRIYDMIKSYEFDSECDYSTILDLLDSAKISFRRLDKNRVWNHIMDKYKKEMYFVPQDTIQSSSY